MNDKYLVRSEKNPGAILNTDNVALDQYKKVKRQKLSMQNEINILREEIKQIKEMLK
jgi:hypothetical protein